MELIREKMMTNHFVGRAISQLTLEDDFNVPDVKPDIEQIIEEIGDIKITEAKPSDGKIILRGKLEFSILYVGANINQPLHRMNGNISFEDSLNLDGLKPDHHVKVRWDMEDLRTRVINSRKVSVRSIVSISVIAQDAVMEEAVVEQSDESCVYALGKDVELSQIHIQKKDIVRVRKEMNVPSSKPNIMDIVWDRVMPGNIEVKVLDGKVNVRGDMNVFVMYASAEEENPLQYFGSLLDFNESVESEGTTEEMIGHIEARMIQWEITVRENEDGEMRKLDVEVVWELSMAIYEEKQMHILEDIYANDRVVRPVVNTLSFDNVMMQNQSSIKLSKVIQVERDKSRILQICQTNANIKVDRMAMSDQGIVVEGVVYVQILYIAADDKIPVNAVKGMIPFSHMVEVPGIHKHCTFEVMPAISSVNSAMADSEEIEVRVELTLGTIVFEQKDLQVIVDVEESSLDAALLDTQPAIVGYIVQPGDSMWTVAKHFSTTQSQLMQINHLESDQLRTGQKLLIIRESVLG